MSLNEIRLIILINYKQNVKSKNKKRKTHQEDFPYSVAYGPISQNYIRQNIVYIRDKILYKRGTIPIGQPIAKQNFDGQNYCYKIKGENQPKKKKTKQSFLQFIMSLHNICFLVDHEMYLKDCTQPSSVPYSMPHYGQLESFGWVNFFDSMFWHMGFNALEQSYHTLASNVCHIQYWHINYQQQLLIIDQVTFYQIPCLAHEIWERSYQWEKERRKRFTNQTII